MIKFYLGANNDPTNFRYPFDDKISLTYTEVNSPRRDSRPVFPDLHFRDLKLKMLPQKEPISDLPLKELGLLNFSLNSTWNAVNTCEIYSFTLGPGRYLIEVWGASGGYDNESVVSKGGYSRGELILVNQTNFYAVAGDVGDSQSNSDVKVNGGCNGGGDGRTGNDNQIYYSGGGGASHVSALESNLSHRFIVAAGAGGSSMGGKGGEGGGLSGADGHLPNPDLYYNGQGANQTHPGTGCAK